MHFSKEIDLRSREAMSAFLRDHYRYPTTHSWNASTSYAHCVKFHRLGLTAAQEDKAYAIRAVDYWSQIQSPIDAFTERQGGYYTIGSNGRCDGYLVLYRSEYRDSGYRSYCPHCEQRNFKRVPPTAGEIAAGVERSGECSETDRCGVCGEARINYTTPPVSLSVYFGRGFDADEDFELLTMDELRSRTRVVMDFDRTCDEIREQFIELLEHCEVEETEVMVPRTVRRLVCTTSPAALPHA